VVIVGGGFGGLNVALGLAGIEVEITVLDRANHHLFQPLLYQVATCGLAPDDISKPIRSVLAHLDRCQVLMAEVTSIDRQSRTVESSAGPFPYDYLVVATGNEPYYFGHDEWRPHAPGLKTLGDALEIRRRVILAFEQAEADRTEDRRRAHLTFLVVGGGPTGVEMAGALAELTRFALKRDFRQVAAHRARILLVEGEPEVLPGFPEKLRQKAREALESLGVEVTTSARVADIQAERVLLADGREIPCCNVIWGAGNMGSPLARTLGAPLDRAGRVEVRPDLSLPEDERVFVIGDLAVFPYQTGGPLPGVAPVAIQMGRHVARQIREDLTGDVRLTFRYQDKGTLATIGRSRAVAEIGRFQFHGFWAWIVWVVVHILYLIGYDNRAVVMVRWIHAYFTYRRGGRVVPELASAADSSLPLPGPPINKK
jgi:NADH dehydrogenase